MALSVSTLQRMSPGAISSPSLTCTRLTIGVSASRGPSLMKRGGQLCHAARFPLEAGGEHVSRRQGSPVSTNQMYTIQRGRKGTLVSEPSLHGTHHPRCNVPLGHGRRQRRHSELLQDNILTSKACNHKRKRREITTTSGVEQRWACVSQ